MNPEGGTKQRRPIEASVSRITVIIMCGTPDKVGYPSPSIFIEDRPVGQIQYFHNSDYYYYYY
jgi:hypothetical protein